MTQGKGSDGIVEGLDFKITFSSNKDKTMANVLVRITYKIWGQVNLQEALYHSMGQLLIIVSEIWESLYPYDKVLKHPNL